MLHQQASNNRPPALSLHLTLPPTHPLPEAIPNLPPSFPATLFGGLSPDDEHVTVWEPFTGKTVAGNAAPYRRNLISWLAAHPGWEEKADELKSSKRRSAARRSRLAAQAFSAICCYPVASFIAADAAARSSAIPANTSKSDSDKAQWPMEDFVRLQESLVRMAQEAHKMACNISHMDSNRWANITSELGESKDEHTVVLCAHHMLSRGICRSLAEIPSIRLGLPAEAGSIVEGALPFPTFIGASSSANLLGANGQSKAHGLSSSAPNPPPVLERSFRAPREPRVTVWNPVNGRTISGNAAPCRRNLDTWMRQHPGWLPKEEGQLSSSRRNRNRKLRPASVPISMKAAPARPQAQTPPGFKAAIEGLLNLAYSPCSGAGSLNTIDHGSVTVGSGPSTANMARDGLLAHGTAQLVSTGRNTNDNETGAGANGEAGGSVPMSSVSSSSLEDGVAMSDDEEADAEDAEPSDMEM